MTGKRKNFEAHGHACVVCWLEGEGLVAFHHLLTRKARPDLSENPMNMMPLCKGCHSLIHAKGTDYMAKAYPRVETWLQRRGWQKNFLGKWFLPGGESSTDQQ